MTRILLILTLLAAPVPALAAQSGPCIPAQPIKPALGGPVVERRVRHLIACATTRWPVPGGVQMALCIAHRESGAYMWPWANSGSSVGTFQNLATLWPGRVASYWERRWLPHAWPLSPFNPRGGVIVSIKLMHAVGLGPWGGGC